MNAPVINHGPPHTPIIPIRRVRTRRHTPKSIGAPKNMSNRAVRSLKSDAKSTQK